jgi:hypothetical protein
LQRDFGRKRWGDEGYAMEELVAELGSAFLSSDLGLTPDVRPDHAACLSRKPLSCTCQPRVRLQPQIFGERLDKVIVGKIRMPVMAPAVESQDVPDDIIAK